MAKQIHNLEIDSTEGDANSTNEAVKWLLEMELVTDPNVHNVLVLNIHRTSKYIRNVELVIDSVQKAILVYLELSKWGQWFHQPEISEAVEETLTQALPSFRFRVVYDPTILAKAIEIVEKRNSPPE